MRQVPLLGPALPRRLDGTPIWLPPGASHPEASRRELRSLRGGDPLPTTLIETGLFETGERFVYECPLCGNVAVNDQRLEPMCTGPSWTDDHPPEIMILRPPSGR